jgi:hypothetical protein
LDDGRLSVEVEGETVTITTHVEVAQAIRLIWYALGEVKDKVDLVAKAIESGSKRLDGLEKLSASFKGSMDELREFAMVMDPHA